MPTLYMEQLVLRLNKQNPFNTKINQNILLKSLHIKIKNNRKGILDTYTEYCEILFHW